MLQYLEALSLVVLCSGDIIAIDIKVSNYSGADSNEAIGRLIRVIIRPLLCCCV